MRTIISKKWSFDAAHQLPNHDGKCANLHGHTYTVEVFLENEDGGTNPPDGRPDECMVVDFYHVGLVWKSYLEPLLDHQFLNDTIGPYMEGITTSENMSKWLLGKFIEHGLPAVAVEVKETESSSAVTYL